MVTLKENFTPEQNELAASLRSLLLEGCHELEEFSNVEVYGLKEDEDGDSILFEIDYSNPEGKGNTIFNQY